MSDSREIIWKHAGIYRWERRNNVSGDPRCDMFTRPSHDPGRPRETLIIVHYAKNGRVVDAFKNGLRLRDLTRNAVLDELEAWAQPGRSAASLPPESPVGGS